MRLERFLSLQNDWNIGFAHLVAALTVCLFFLPQSMSGQQAPVPKMTLSQVEELVEHKVPDATLQVQIQKRGLTPAPTSAFIEPLRAKGAGPLTLAAVKAAMHGSPQSTASTTPLSQTHTVPNPSESRSAHQPSTNPSQTVGRSHVAEKVKIDPGVAESLLLHRTDPVYSPIAKAARVTGIVLLQVTVSETGRVEDVQAIGGPPLLRPAAIDAVKNWLYRPLVLSANAVKFDTTISVSFTLGGSNSASLTTQASQPVATRPRDTGPSLAATISFIKDKSIQPMSYQLTIDTPAGVQNVINDRGHVGDFDFDSSACSLHSTSVSDVTAEIRKKGKTYSRYNQHEDTSISYSFKDVDSVQVLRGDDYYKQRFTKLGHPEYSITTDSPFFVVKLSSSKLVFSIKETSKKDNEAAVSRDKTADESAFSFRDEETANSVAKAVNRAINLCRADISQQDAESLAPHSEAAAPATSAPTAMDQSAVTTTEPIVVGTFYLVDSTGLLHHLESTSLTVIGANSSAPVFSVAGARSTARYPEDPTYRFLVHLPSGTIPALYQYIEDQSTRTLTFKKVLGFASLKKGKLLSLDTLGVKDGATFVKPQHPLAAGEYCLSVTDQGTNLSCFGIDAQ